jgi:beta-glucanase (GH16 family)
LLADQYELDFSDEFNDASIDVSKWTVDVSGKSRSPRLGLSIADRWWVSNNVKEENGNLVLDVDKFDAHTMHCGSINAKKNYEKTFGYLDVRMKIA